jgi:hypothetical protein
MKRNLNSLLVGGNTMLPKTKRLLRMLSLASAVLLIAFLAGCSLFTNEKGTLKLNLTDAPIADAEDVEGVYITIDSIAYHINDQWVEDTSFTEPQKFNLLELTGGEIAPLSNLTLSSGEVTQIRFMLDVTKDGDAPSAVPGSYIAIDPDGTADGDASDDDIFTLFVPSGDQTGYKANGPFTVPANGTVEITADFDVRKSVHLTGEGTYILRPTIRLVVNDQAGKIAGGFTDDTTDAYSEYTIFAYESGTYDPEAEQDSESGEFTFPNAVSSAAAADSDGDDSLDSYTIPFLAAGDYDLIIAGVSPEGTYGIVDDLTYTNIEVTADVTTQEDIDLTL